MRTYMNTRLFTCFGGFAPASLNRFSGTLGVVALVFLLNASTALAANWYVDASAVGAANGTSWANAWTSFAQINQAGLAPDDVVWIRSGTYNERFTLTQSGTSGHRIKYVGTGTTRPILRGINGGAMTDIAILNLEIAQLTTANNYDAITLRGATRWLIQDNYIHNTYLSGVNVINNIASSYNIIRHNTFADIGAISGGNGGGSNPNVMNMVGDYNLIEYNTVNRSMDRTRAFGTGNVVRNNYWGYTDTSLYPSSPQYPSHTDGFQSFEGGPALVQFLYERNYDVDNTDTIGGTNAHGFLVQDAVGSNGFTWEILRFNQMIRPGGGGASWQNVSRTYIYNNTFIALQNGSPSNFNNAFSWTYPSTFSAASSDLADARNNTFAYCPKCLDPQGIMSSAYRGTNFTSASQHSFNTGTQLILPTGASPSNLSQIDPQFVDGTGAAGHDDYRLKATSPLRGTASAITTASGAGSGSTALTVADAKRLFDGWGIADADIIKIGAGAYVQIASINYNTNVVTLASPRTWSSGDGVYIKGTEDVGALPYSFAASYSITNTTPIVIAAGPTTLTATCTNPDAVRMVEFQVDGVPVGTAYTAPYSVAWTSDGVIHAITARAYSAWSSATLSQSDINVAAKITSQPSTVSSNIGGSATLTVGISGYPTPTVQWYKNGVLIPGATSTSLSFPSLVSGDSGAYTASVSNQYATVVSNVANIYIGVVPPYVVAQSSGQTVTSGTDVQLTFFAGGTPPPSQQWYLNGVAIAGATGPILNLTGATRAVAGTYTNVATNSAGTVTSNPMVVTVQVPSRLANVSIRTFPGTGAQVLIAGFVTTGASKAILIRGVGPSLSQYVTSPVFADPILNLYIGSSTTPSQTNDDWGSGATLKSLFTQLGAFPLLDGSKDSVIYSTLTPNLYTAQVNGSGSGLGIAEVYDADSAENPAGHIVNLSARTQVGTGDAVLIAGFVITGDFSKQVLIRAVGPTLATYGVTGVLADPKAELYLSGGTTPIQSNDNWGGGSTLKAAFNSVGAFALPDDASKDAAMLATLAPGAYSVVVSGVNNTTGVALVEIYEMP